MHFANSFHVCVGFNHSSRTIWTPDDAALELRVGTVTSVFPSKYVSDGLKNAQYSLALQRVHSSIGICTTKPADFFEGLLVPKENKVNP
jgi:hypothetical protein